MYPHGTEDNRHGTYDPPKVMNTPHGTQDISHGKGNSGAVDVSANAVVEVGNRSFKGNEALQNAGPFLQLGKNS